MYNINIKEKKRMKFLTSFKHTPQMQLLKVHFAD